MALKAINKSTIQEGVYEALYQAIIAGELVPGEKVTLRLLAEKLNVSVMPVREAIRRLEAKNFVTISSNKHIIINKISRAYFNQIYQIRIMLESYVVKTASRNRSEESLTELAEVLMEMKTARDDETRLDANRRFHDIIYREADLPAFKEVIDSMWERVSPYLFILLRTGVNFDHEIFFTNHDGMLQGMKEKDAEKTAHWLERDLAYAAEMIVNILDTQDPNYHL